VAKFKTRIVRKARFVVTQYTPEQMISLGQSLIDDGIKARLARAEDVYDAAAPPLTDGSRKTRYSVSGQKNVTYNSRGYASYKRRFKLNNGASVSSFDPMNPRAHGEVRDWHLTGRTLRAMRVLSASAGKAVIGFSDPVANMRAVINNRRHRQFGVSPKDQQILLRKLASLPKFVTAKAA
jgi:hypothetical protein